MQMPCRVCTVCSRSLSRNASLKDHMNIHNGDKPYVCHQEDCDETFANNSTFRRHRDSHKTFKCSRDNCPDKFCRNAAEVKPPDLNPLREVSADGNSGDSFLATNMGKSLHASTQTVTSEPVSAIALDSPIFQGNQAVTFADSWSGNIKPGFPNLGIPTPDSSPRQARVAIPAGRAEQQPLRYLPTSLPRAQRPLPVEPITRAQHFPTTNRTHHPIQGSLVPAAVPRERRHRKRRAKCFTPFSRCFDLFDHHPFQIFSRPPDGKVNGYIKFYWPSTEGRWLPTTISPSYFAATQITNQTFEQSPRRPYSALPASTSIHSFYPASFTVAPPQNGAHLPSVKRSFQSSCSGDVTEAPQLFPSQNGLDTLMDTKGRQLFNFCKFCCRRSSPHICANFRFTDVRNWCPGRSVLIKTNPWLLFASTQHISSVVAAMQSLAGIYVYDYTPTVHLRHLVSRRFAIAEARLSELLQRACKLDNSESHELITLASLLSMQDVILTERRVKGPYLPRWLAGFRQAECVLQSIDDPRSHFFYKESNATQVSALRTSQSVIVGRAVVLAQTMMSSPPLATFDPIAETSRFGFLLHGSEADVYEIHGGCGFSRKLLYIFSQVTYLSTRMLQDSETPIVPVTAQMLYGQLMKLHQWSGEYDSWEASKSRPQPIEWIRQTDENYVVQEAKKMTEVTAEAWRLAGMIYLQCRLFRLPRNHYMVIDNIADLAKCISIMPTSGPVFTAQAPLLPVFFLGLLATVEEHIQVAEIWFQQVIKTPVRSSVPPLYETLERIQSWINHEVPVPAMNMELPRTIAERQAWWEPMVFKVQEKEKQVLCVT